MPELTTRWVLVWGLLTLIVLAVGYALLWRLLSGRGRVIPMPPRYPIAPWSGSEVALALLMFFAVPLLVRQVMVASEFLPSTNINAKEEAPPKTRNEIVADVISGPLTVAAMLAVLWFGSQTRPKRVGLRIFQWRRSLYMACMSYLLITPIVLGVNQISQWLTEEVKQEAQKHPLVKLVEADPRPGTLVLVTVMAVVLAPVTEELLFRGIMMPWLGRRWWGGWAAMAGAIAMGLASLPQSKAPLSFALLFGLIGIAITFPHIGEQWTRRSIIGTSLLFAMFHMAAWPSPIPLFFLAIALGWLAHRSRSLVAPIILHALFNATSTIVMLWTVLKAGN